MEIILSIAISVRGSTGLFSFVLALMKRRWDKQDAQSARHESAERRNQIIEEVVTKIDSIAQTQDKLVRAQKVSMAYDIRYLGSCCIYAKEISLGDRETLDEMYDAYKELPGADGMCNTVMSEVRKLAVKGKNKNFEKKDGA